MTDNSEALLTLIEMFPNYSPDLISCVMEAMGGGFEESLEALLSLDETGAGGLDPGFLDVGSDKDVQMQIEHIIKEGREEAKQGKKPSWKDRLKNVFKKKAPANVVEARASPNSSGRFSGPSAPPLPSGPSLPSGPALPSAPSLPSPLPPQSLPAASQSAVFPSQRTSVPQQEDSDDEEIISFTVAEAPKDARGKYQQVPMADDIELVSTKKS